MYKSYSNILTLVRLILVILLYFITVTDQTTAAIQFTVLDAPSVPGTRGTILSGINNCGEIVGYYNFNTTGSSGNEARSVIWDSLLNPTIFAVAGSSRTTAFGINDAAQTVGVYLDTISNQYRGFLRNSDGTYAPIDVPGAIETTASGINNAGQVSGVYTFDLLGSIVTRSFIRETDGTYNYFEFPGGIQTNAWGINDAGQVTGHLNVPVDDVIGFVRNADDSYLTFDVPSFSQGTLPKDINNLGQITGIDATGHVSFARDVNGTFTTFSKPGSLVTVATGLNEAGTIVGSFVDPDDGDISHGFIASGTFESDENVVVPEPSQIVSWVGLGVTSAAVIWFHNRRKSTPVAAMSRWGQTTSR